MPIEFLTKEGRDSPIASLSNMFVGDEFANELAGFGGADTLVGNAGDDTIFGGGGFDFIMGGRGSDFIKGGTGKDTIHGGKDDDILDGGAGADWLSGDMGADQLKGGSGNDVFAFKKSTADATDTILDFADGDMIELAGFDVQTASFAASVTGDVTVTVDGIAVFTAIAADGILDSSDINFV